MNEYKVKNKLTGFVFVIRAWDKDHAINLALSKDSFPADTHNYKVIK